MLIPAKYTALLKRWKWWLIGGAGFLLVASQPAQAAPDPADDPTTPLPPPQPPAGKTGGGAGKTGHTKAKPKGGTSSTSSTTDLDPFGGSSSAPAPAGPLSTRAWLSTFTKLDRHEASMLAVRLHTACDGIGTDVDEINACGRSMRLKVLPFQLIAYEYDATYHDKLHEPDLVSRLKDELSDSDFDEFMAIVTTK